MSDSGRRHWQPTEAEMHVEHAIEEVEPLAAVAAATGIEARLGTEAGT